MIADLLKRSNMTPDLEKLKLKEARLNFDSHWEYINLRCHQDKKIRDRAAERILKYQAELKTLNLLIISKL